MNDRFKFRCWDDYNRVMLDLQEQDTNPYNISDFAQHNIMQCTGLKDKNGKLIYEGDILGGTYGNLYVHYCDKCKQFQLKANDYGCMACNGDIHWCELVESEDEIEVIGNIYEDKELLECQK